MQLNAYSIFDNKALQYHPPFFAATDGAAMRSFQDLVNDHNSTVSRHPGDYSLFRVGTFDDNKGFFAAVSPLVHVVDAVALVRVQPPLPVEHFDFAKAAPAQADWQTFERETREFMTAKGHTEAEIKKELASARRAHANGGAK